MIVSFPQLEADSETGAMKSLISDVNETAERLFTYAEEKDSQAPGGMIHAQTRLIAASPNCCAGRLTAGLPPRFSETWAALVSPSEQLPEIGFSVPQALPVHFLNVSVGVFEPPWNE